MKASMSHEEKIQFMRIACNICKLALTDEHIDLMVSLYDELLKKGGEMNMMDTAKIQAACIGREIDRGKLKLPK